ncbi:hypothetical protein [Fluviicola taffensis]|uniref:DUF7832 domain-containing protein n=1 Tax=Fluviicola taffensis (strain DSM 16823 / NCIMB 13979 / RW262) TaxID=755732 RepID=F2IJH5_FLUTR|nr:hypothetical protein [Fluviicola taffensis]AEA42863.1 hypothetical protein Fluta_0862 [Fluviicola taffensis DSM 16823]
MASIDQANWHYGGDFPKGLPKENGGTHIGMYLNWIIDNNLLEKTFLEDSAEGIQKVKSRKITGREFLFEYCDEKLLEYFLNEEGLEFTTRYYKRLGTYMYDYDELLKGKYDSLYEIPNTWENYDLITTKITKEFEKWKSRRTKKSWQFWKK